MTSMTTTTMTSPAGDLIDLSFLTDDERETIAKVLDRDDTLRQQEMNRISQLSAELKSIRMRGVIRAGQDSAASCARCRKPFGRGRLLSFMATDAGRVCSGCRHRVCNECRQPVDTSVSGTSRRRWLCVYCLKQMELDALTGRWLQGKYRSGGKLAELAPGSEVVRESLKLCLRRPSYACSEPGDVHCSQLMASDVSDAESCDEYAVGQRYTATRIRSLPTAAYRTAAVRATPSTDRWLYDRIGTTDESVNSSSQALTVLKIGDDDEELDKSVDISPSIDEPLRIVEENGDEEEARVVPEVQRRDLILDVNQTSRAFVESTEKNLNGNVSRDSVSKGRSPEGADAVTCVSDVKRAPTAEEDRGISMAKEDKLDSGSKSPSISVPTTPHSVTKVVRRSIPSIPEILVTTSAVRRAETLPKNSSLNAAIHANFDKLESANVFSQSQPFLNTKMSASRDSIESSSSNEEGVTKAPISGEIEVGLAFNHKNSTLEVNVKQCRQLRSDCSDNVKIPNPYIKTYLLPDKSKGGKRKSTVKRQTLNPVFNEILKYRVKRNDLQNRVLRVSVLSYERLGRNEFLGEVNVPLDHRVFIDPVPRWYKLQNHRHRRSIFEVHKGCTVHFFICDHCAVADRLDPFERVNRRFDVSKTQVAETITRGDVTIRLRFQTVTKLTSRHSSKQSTNSLNSTDVEGQLEVIVKQASGVVRAKDNSLADPFCICRLLPERLTSQSSNAIHRTSVVRKDCNPVWNELFTFTGLTLSSLTNERSLELTVWHHVDSRTARREFLGGIRLGLNQDATSSTQSDVSRQTTSRTDSTPAEASVWQAVVVNPDNWIEKTLPLRADIEHRTS